jgi:TolB-like protein/Flp pilus assembly protein TadD
MPPPHRDRPVAAAPLTHPALRTVNIEGSIPAAPVNHKDARTALDPKEIRAQLRRILASDEFASSERMQEFLRLAVGEALAGRAGRLKEYVIGVEVFRRPPSFDPGIDPIVRVEARRLRSKLEHYYAGAGSGDPIVIELPKGRYSAVFRARSFDESPHGSRAGASAIAVLPFQTVGGTTEAQEFSAGLTWELTHRLTRIEGLAVVAPTSIAQLREGFADPARVGSTLHVGTVLTGSVRQANGRIRIIAQLVATSTGVCLWSETYDRKLEDIFSIQDEIAQAIVARLRIKLAKGEPPSRRPAAYNLDAYQLYLRGRAVWNSRTAEGLREGLKRFREAAELDPNFALAWAGMADAWSTLADYALEPPSVARPAARAAAERALSIDPSLAEAHASLALQTGIYEWNWEEAELHYRRALDLSPGYATAHHWYAVDLLALLARFDESFDELEIAIQLDPLSPIIAEGRGYTLLLRRRYEEAVKALDSLIADQPDFYKGYTSRGRALLHLGRYDEALESLEKGRQLAGRIPTILGAMGQAFALSGRREAALLMLNSLAAEAGSSYVPSTCFALIHAGLGQPDRALEWMERGFDRKEPAMVAIAVHPGYDSLRAELRFESILRKMNLPVLPELRPTR